MFVIPIAKSPTIFFNLHRSPSDLLGIVIEGVIPRRRATVLEETPIRRANERDHAACI